MVVCILLLVEDCNPTAKRSHNANSNVKRGCLASLNERTSQIDLFKDYTRIFVQKLLQFIST